MHARTGRSRALVDRRTTTEHGVDGFPLSAAQLGIWSAQQLVPEVPIVIAQYIDITTALDLDLMRRACIDAGLEMGSLFVRLYDRHGRPRQVVDPRMELPLVTIDLRGASDPEAAAGEWMRAEYGRPLDLLADRLVCIAAVRLTETRWFLYVRGHHVVLDGYGALTLINRAAHRYTAYLAGEKPDTCTVGELRSLVESELAYRGSDRFERDRRYWAERLGPRIPDPVSSARPGTDRQIIRTTPLDTDAAVLAAAVRRFDAPDSVLIVAAFAAYEACRTGVQNVVLSLPVAVRITATARAAAGMTSNIVPLRIRVRAEMTVAEVVRETRTAITGALRHQRYRHEDMRRDIATESGRTVDLFGPQVNIMPFRREITVGPDSGIIHLLSTGVAADLALNVTRSVTGSGLDIDFEVNPNRYPEKEARQRHSEFLGYLRDFLARDSRHRVGGSPRADIALSYEGGSLSYAEFAVAVNRLARYLISRGIGPDSLVALVMRRSPELVIAVHAVHAAGAGYVPLDPEHPAERNGYVLDTARPQLILTTHRDQAEVPAAREARAPAVVPVDSLDVSEFSSDPLTDSDRLAPLLPDHLAYVLFTSGSTGLPKGVAVTHGSLHDHLSWMQHRYQLRPDDVVLLKTPATFDVSVWELLWPTRVGARLVLARHDGHGDPGYLADLVVAQQVTVTQFVPSMLAAFVAEPRSVECSSLRYLFAAGEALAGPLANRAASSTGASVHNLYGPTEATVAVTAHEVTAADERSVPIGAPGIGTDAYVLDEQLRPVPTGTAGELYLAGAQVARGYLGRVDLTAERFVADPFGPTGTRMYRTGDLVTRSDTGELEFLGRTDFQVKLRGLRIELGEIESVLVSLDGIAQSAVAVVPGAHGGRLVGYLVPVAHGGVPRLKTRRDDEHPLARRDDVGATAYPGGEGSGLGQIDLEQVESALSLRLPRHMVPECYVLLETMPLTTSGKLDRRALPVPTEATEPSREPVGAREARLAALFAEVLGRDRVGAEDSFFGVGGDSILSIQLVSRARAAGLVFTPKDVFDQRTVAGLARIAGETAPTRALAELPGGGVGPLELTPVVARFLEHGHCFPRYCQTMALALPADIDDSGLVATLTAVVDHHDMLRSTLTRRPAAPDRSAAQWRFEVTAAGAVDVAARLTTLELPADAAHEDLIAVLDETIARVDPECGRMIVFTRVRRPQHRDVLLIAAHHLVVDGVSWRILLPDLASAWAQRNTGRPTLLPPTGTSMRRWAQGLTATAHAPRRRAELPYWQGISATPDPVLGDRAFDPVVDTHARVRHVSVCLPADITDAVITALPTVFHGSVDDGLLAALAMAVQTWRQRRAVIEPATLVTLESHGREESAVPGADLTRTVGWFTTVYPIRIDLTGLDLTDAFAGGAAAGAVIVSVKEQLRAIPDRGIGYGLLRYLGAARLAETAPQIGFNYLGRVTAPESPARESSWLPIAGVDELTGTLDPDMPAAAAIDINAFVAESHDGARLTADFGYPATLLDDAEVRELTDLWVAALTGLAQHARAADAGVLAASDFTLVRVEEPDIERWERRFGAISDIWPLSELQRGFAFHAQLTQAADTGGVDVYVSQLVVSLSGEVDGFRLRGAAQEMLARVPGLRTAFDTTAAGIPVQVVVSRATIPWTEFDLSGSTNPEDRAADIVERERLTPFDLAAPPLLRCTLIRLPNQRWTLVLTNHHIILDGWSLPLLLRELLTLYTVRDHTALPTPRSYRSFLEWVGGQDRAASLSVWRTALSGVESTLLVGRDTDHRVTVPERCEFHWDAAGTARLTRFAADHGVTVNTVLQAAWGLLLARTLGRDDVVFGATVSGRPPVLAGVESMIGLFINTVPVRVAFDPAESIAAVLDRLQGEQAALLDHHYVGLAEVQATVGVGGLFDTLLVFESFPIDADGLTRQAADLDGMSVEGVTAWDATHYPLTLVVHPGAGLRMQLAYQPDLFDANVIRILGDRLVHLLTRIVGEPALAIGAIDLLLPGEREVLLGEWHSAGVESAATLVGLVDARVVEQPHAIAVRDGSSALTYGELSRRADRLAGRLFEHGVRRGDLVAVALERTVDMPVALLAVLRAGAGYLPIDTGYPAERLEFVLTDATPTCVITAAELRDRLPSTGIPVVIAESSAAEPDFDEPFDAPNAPHPDDLAYVIYTSGSTGVPKGVAVTHRNAVQMFTNTLPRFGFDSSDVWTVFHSFAFDFSVWELWGALITGGRAVIVDATTSRAPDRFRGLLAQEGVTVLSQTPTAFRQLSEADRAAASPLVLRHVIFGGEALDPHLLDGWYERYAPDAPHLVNMYGITETTVHATFRHLAPRATTDPSGGDIGRVLPGMAGYLLDARLVPTPAGMTGEMYLSGPQVTRGYLGRPALTATRFVANPYGPPGSRMYRSGDLANWRGEGLDYVGRGDQQVQLRGFRIELGEIEAVLTEFDGVRDAEAIIRDDRLLAYVVSAATVDIEDLYRFIEHRLPSHMVPAAVTPVTTWPLTTNGKLDIRALPDPDFTARSSGRAPRTEREHAFAALFAETLGVPEIGIDDDFFRMGGDSLSAVRLGARIRAALGEEVTVRTIFDTRTVAALAARPARAVTLPARGDMTRPDIVPLSYPQRRLLELNELERREPGPGRAYVFGLRLPGPNDPAAVAAAITDLVARHEILRSVFPDSQVVLDPDTIDFTTARTDDPQADMAAYAARPFDLRTEVPLRVRLYPLAADTDVLLIVLHHMAADGWSVEPFVRDLGAALAARRTGAAPTWSPLALQYAEHAVWQSNLIEGHELSTAAADQLDYWTGVLSGLPETPWMLRRPTTAAQPYAARSHLRVDKELYRRLDEYARANDTSVFMVVNTAFAVVLNSFGFGDDIAICSPTAGRTEVGLEDLVGRFTNFLVLRTDLSGEPTFPQLLTQVRRTNLEALENQDLPYEFLVEQLNLRSRLRFRFAFQNLPSAAVHLPGMRAEWEYVPAPTPADFELSLILFEEKDSGGSTRGLWGYLEYATDVVTAIAAEQMTGLLARIVREQAGH